MALPCQPKPMVVLDGAALEAARVSRGLTKQGVADLADVTYSSAWRVLASHPVSRDMAEPVATALGLKLDDVVVGLTGDAPADGISPEAWALFDRAFQSATQKATKSCYAKTAKVAAKRGWHWPSYDVVRGRINKELASGI